MTGGFAWHKPGYAENISIAWCHYGWYHTVSMVFHKVFVAADP